MKSANPKQKDNLILNLSIQFSLDMIKYASRLKRIKEYEIASQVLRSATSIGANICEAQGCESVKDFIHKLRVALKEANETEYWLILCDCSDDFPETDKEMPQLIIIRKVLSKIIHSTLSNQEMKEKKFSQ